MTLDQKLDRWVAARLIDRESAARIQAFEGTAPARPVALWAVAGLGLFALALGLILLVSANWDRIPAAVKLAAHMALTGGAAVAVWIGAERGRTWLTEAALFLLAALVLAGIALQAQVYGLAGPDWEPLILWLALAGPALLVAGRTRLTAYAFVAMAVLGPTTLALDTLQARGPWLWAQSATMAVPAALVALSLPASRLDGGFRRGLQEAGLLLMMALASIAHFGWASTITGPQALDNAIRLVLPALAAAVAIGLARRGGLPPPLVLPLLAGPVLAVGLALAIPHPDTAGSRLAGVLVFGALWGAVARGAAAAGWSALFAIAIAAIAVRIFIVYVELFGSLAATGLGLVGGGALVVALAAGWHRIVRGRQTP